MSCRCTFVRRGGQARTVYSPAYDAIFAFIDYAGAIPCGYQDPSRTNAAYDVTTAVPLAPGPLRALAHHSSAEKTASFTGMITIPNNTVYDGVIVRCPWDWEKTVGTTQVGKFASNVTGLVKVSKITDGTSKTLLVGEKYVRSDAYDGPFLGTNRNSDDRGWSDGYDADLLRSTCFPPIQDSDGIGWSTFLKNYFDDDPSTAFALSNVFHFGSRTRAESMSSSPMDRATPLATTSTRSYLMRLARGTAMRRSQPRDGTERAHSKEKPKTVNASRASWAPTALLARDHL